MGGPMAYLAPGWRSHTAWAMTWAVEWRRTCSPSGSAAPTGSTATSACTGQDRSRSSPSTRAQMASARRTSPTGEPASTSLMSPPGSVTFGMERDDRRSILCAVNEDATPTEAPARTAARSERSARPVLVAGGPRTGTSWVLRALHRAGGVALIYEPDNEWPNPFALKAKLPLGRFPVLEAGAAAPPESAQLGEGAFGRV